MQQKVIENLKNFTKSNDNDWNIIENDKTDDWKQMGNSIFRSI